MESFSEGRKAKVIISIILLIALVTFLVYSGGQETFETVDRWKEIPGIIETRVIIINYEKNLSFPETMKTLQWDSYQAALNSTNSAEIEAYSTELLQKLVPFLVLPPQKPVNVSCLWSLLPTPTITSTCIPLQTKRKVGMLWQFGFDVDALEIHLNELDALVDKFFIIESIKTHSKFIRSKPLIWDKLKNDQRFVSFSEKVVHFIVDDANLATKGEDIKNVWHRENLQELLRWRKFLEWNNVTGYFSSYDLLGFGDVDEITSWENVAYLKNCEMPSDPVDIGIWFPFDGPNTIFTSDFPIKGHPKTLGDPTFWTVDSAMRYWNESGIPPSRMRGKSNSHLLGGIHLSRYAYPPFQMVKLLAATEVNWNDIQVVVDAGMLYSQNETNGAESKLNTIPSKVMKCVESLEKFRERNSADAEAIVKIPWFLQCNRERYPGFDKLPDSRLDHV